MWPKFGMLLYMQLLVVNILTLSLPTVTCLLILNSCLDDEMMYIQCRVSQLCIVYSQSGEYWLILIVSMTTLHSPVATGPPWISYSCCWGSWQRSAVLHCAWETWNPRVRPCTSFVVRIWGFRLLRVGMSLRCRVLVGFLRLLRLVGYRGP